MDHRVRAFQRLRDFNVAVDEGDSDLAAETGDLGGQREMTELSPGAGGLEAAIAQESIIMRRHRPVLRVMNDTTDLVFRENEDSEIWRARLTAAREQIDAAVLAVGRINLKDGPMEWVGTGWIVREDIIATNRHVAEKFVSTAGAELSFLPGLRGPIGPEIDFLKEFERTETREFRLIRPLYVAPEGGPDIAFFEVEQVHGDNRLAKRIRLAQRARETNNVATIGYPALDSRIPDIELMEEIYGRQYNKKRLAPGAVTDLDEIRVWHNCTTLGGNSGSAVIDLDSGEALGLHFSGAFLQTNYAVRSDIVARTLEDVLSGARPSHRPLYAQCPPRETAAGQALQRPAGPGGPQGLGAAQGAGGTQPPGGGTVEAGAATVTVPLTITVSLGAPALGAAPAAGVAPAAAATAPAMPAPSLLIGHDEDEIEADVESRPEDYEDCEGYAPNFISERDGFDCPLPAIRRDKHDVLSFDFMDARQTELKYQNFSVVMSRSRRLCFFSAVNINGADVARARRAPWKWEPRIPSEQQVMRECYGDPPRFSRGHMTRRQDPSWGPQAVRGNRDSMHVTNTAPQMQAFDSPIWLALEDYALDNAIDDGMKISVFTGPFFNADDPFYYGVQVPVSFWKIIAFKHDYTGRLSATGYKMDQRRSLPPRTEDEFVFGDFISSHTSVTTQVSIRSIEAGSGIDFGPLAALDPLAAEEESVGIGGVGRPILASNQIRFF